MVYVYIAVIIIAIIIIMGIIIIIIINYHFYAEYVRLLYLFLKRTMFWQELCGYNVYGIRKC